MAIHRIVVQRSEGVLRRQSPRAFLVVVALLTTGSLLRAQDCESPTLIRVPLTSSMRVHRAETPSGYVGMVVRDAPGWEVQVFRARDRYRRDNLLYPVRNWHGAFPCQVQPNISDDIFPATRRVAARSTPHSVCIRLKAVSQSMTNGHPAYKGGWLEIGWIEGTGKHD
jgi:hypothetical protein